MDSRCCLRCALILLACHLTLAASGDDFSLVRLVFPCLFTGDETLPLDDPNTDFLLADDLGATHWSDGASCGTADLVGSCAAHADLVAACAGPSVAIAPALHAHLSRDELTTPLRC